MMHLFRRLGEEEKSRDVRYLEERLKKDFEGTYREFASLANRSIRPDVRVGIALLLVPLSVVNTGLTAARYSIIYTGSYIEAVSRRLGDQ